MIKRKISIRGVINFIITIAMLILILVSGFISARPGEVYNFNILNRRPVVVVSGSMLPAIQINSMSIMEYCKVEQLEVGDVAVYNHPSLKIMITHRVIEKHDDGIHEPYIITQGDANKVNDGIHITNDMLVGKLVETYNWSVPIMNMIMKDVGEVDTMALLIMLAIISVAVTVVSSILVFIYNTIAAIILVNSSDKTLGKLIDTYENNIKIQEDLKSSIYNIESIRIKPGDSLKDIILKIKLVSNLRTLNSNIEDISSIQKSAEKLTN